MSTSDRPSDLTPAQLRAVEALLTGADATAAAQAASVSTRTLRRWRKEPAFVAAVRAAGRSRAAEAASVLLAVQGQAVAVLAAALRDPSPTVKIRAAVALLQLGQVAREDDHDERLDALERRGRGEEERWHTEPVELPAWPA